MARGEAMARRQVEQTADERMLLSIAEARTLALAAQGLLHRPTGTPGLEELRATIERLGVVQIDTISVVERSQYLVLWSRLGAYNPALFDALLSPHRHVFEYWSHAASIVPMRDYPYYRHDMLQRGQEHLWDNQRSWMRERPEVVQQTLDAIRERGPLASADFERDPASARPNPWDWYGPKESRRALEVLWSIGELMIHSRRAGQKVYDLRERVLAEAFNGVAPSDDALPSLETVARYFVRHTVHALGVVAPSWLWDYFRLGAAYWRAASGGTLTTKRGAALAALDALAEEGVVVPATVEGIGEPVFIATERLADLEWVRSGGTPTRTTLLSPFDSLIWDRARTRALWDYEVVFEAYVVPEKRRYGYYCLAILHQGRLVGRIDPKMDRQAKRLIVRAAHLEPGVVVDEGLVEGLADTLRDLAVFLGARDVVVEHSEPVALAKALGKRLKTPTARARRAAAIALDGK